MSTTELDTGFAAATPASATQGPALVRTLAWLRAAIRSRGRSKRQLRWAMLRELATDASGSAARGAKDQE